jgi:hypothetical protein
MYAERMINHARTNSMTTRRLASTFIKGEETMKKLFGVLGPRYAYRPAGFTRVIHAKRRDGDNAPLSYLELVDRPNEIRPPILCTPASWQQLLRQREINTERQRITRY